jgi:hypothetical protein
MADNRAGDSSDEDERITVSVGSSAAGNAGGASGASGAADAAKRDDLSVRSSLE